MSRDPLMVNGMLDGLGLSHYMLYEITIFMCLETPLVAPTGFPFLLWNMDIQSSKPLLTTG